MNLIKIMILIALVGIVFPGSLLFAQTSGKLNQDEAAIREIKNTLAEWNKAFESKNADKFCSYESTDFLNSRGGLEKTKKMLTTYYFSRWKEIKITSTVESVIKSGNNYVVSEAVIFNNTGLNGNNKSEDAERLITFTNENGVWKISNLQNQLMPAEYKKLNGNYDRRGEPGLVYVSHLTHNFISVIDAKSDSLVGKIPCGNGSYSVAFSSFSGNGYVSDYNSNEITVFNKNTNETVATVPAGVFPSDILLTPDGKFVLITHESQDGLWVMSTVSNKIIKKIPDISGIPVNDTFNNKIYISAIFTPFVSVLNASDLSFVKQIETGGRPMDIAISSDGKYAYVANYDLNEVEKIDTKLDSVVARIPGINGGRGIAVSPNDKYVYVTNVKSNTVTVVDPATDKVSGTIIVGKMPTTICMDKENKSAYVSNQGSASISVIDIKTNTVIKTIQVTDNPIRVQVY